MMDGPSDSGSTITLGETATHTTAEDAATDPSTDGVPPLEHEASSDARESRKLSCSSSDHDGSTSGAVGLEDTSRLEEGSAASEMNGSSSRLTDASSLSHSSCPSIDSGESSYTSFERLINDEPKGKNSLHHYDFDSDEACDEQYPKKIDKGKGKEVAAPAEPPVESQKVQALNVVPWAQDPERPPQKLPIRFTDCVGRSFVWPWKKAKTWKGAKRLVESAFLYVDVLGPHVFAGHYDLTIQGMWSDPKTAAINPTLVSYHPANSGDATDELGAAGSASSSSQAGPPPPPTNDSPHVLSKTSGRGAIILPELWEDVVEPGLLISMRMWPIAPSPSAHSHSPPLPAVPMPPPFQPHGTGVGRGRGAGPAAGRGAAHPPPPQQQQPPGWHQPPRRSRPPLVIVPYSPPKGKTRKRQDGL